MKKSLIALAVAGAFAAPAFAASSNVDIYGKMRVSLDHVDVTNTSSNWTLNDRVSRIGFKGSEDLGGGMKAVWQIENGVQFDGAAGALGGLGLRNTFVGLSSGFGTVLAGRHDTPYKLAGSADLFGDTAADSQSGSSIIGYDIGGNGLGGFDIRAGNAIAYVSPTFSGFHVAAAIVPGETSRANNAPAGTPIANGLADAWSLAAVYANGPLSVTAGYEKHTTDLANAILGTTLFNQGSESAFKLNGSYTFGDFKLGATYEDQSSFDLNTLTAGTVGKIKSKNYLVSGAYGMGPITLAAQYGKRNVNGEAEKVTIGEQDLTRWTLGAIYNLSKRTSAYVAYNHDNLDNSTAVGVTPALADRTTKVWTFGVNHDF